MLKFTPGLPYKLSIFPSGSLSPPLQEWAAYDHWTFSWIFFASTDTSGRPDFNVSWMWVKTSMSLPLALFLIITVVIFSRSFHRRVPALPLPPSPAKVPVVGNLLVAPIKRQWDKYATWSKEFGSDVIHLRVLGTSIIVLNSYESAHEILNRRSALSSSRPVSIMLNKLMGWEFDFAFIPYGHDWRIRRRMFWQEFNPSKSSNHHPTQLRCAKRFLRNLFDEPAQFAHHCRYAAASSVVEVSYGSTAQSSNDPLITLADKALHRINEAGITGTYLVDYLPMLQHVPSWFPGPGFRRYGRIAHAEVMDMINIPFARVREQILSGEETAPSMITRVWARDQSIIDDPEKERLVKEVASVAYAAGADTTPSPLVNFIAAMVLYPEVQAKAQAELDSVLRLARLPAFEDRPLLLYTQAVMWEALRSSFSFLTIACLVLIRIY
ncbi:hypothetical protein ONZ45_g10135 [Pleurotus djamor]|nr:hypothetical protein ONZ45_g10135 [Pleurotus djamor]